MDQNLRWEWLVISNLEKNRTEILGFTKHSHVICSIDFPDSMNSSILDHPLLILLWNYQVLTKDNIGTWDRAVTLLGEVFRLWKFFRKEWAFPYQSLGQFQILQNPIQKHFKILSPRKFFPPFVLCVCVCDYLSGAELVQKSGQKLRTKNQRRFVSTLGYLAVHPSINWFFLSQLSK